MQAQTLESVGYNRENQENEKLKKEEERRIKIRELLQEARKAQEEDRVKDFYRSLSFAIYYMKEFDLCSLFLKASPEDFCALCGEKKIKTVIFLERNGEIRLDVVKDFN